MPPVSSSKVKVRSTSPSDIVFLEKEFPQVLQSSAFRDKTGFIKFFIESTDKHMVIHGPRRFGKTVNLNMVRDFLQAEVASNGQIKTPRSTDKYKLYYENELQVGKETDLFQDYFAQYPTIYFNFKTLSVTSYEKFLETFRESVAMAFAKHDYLLDVYKNSSDASDESRLNEFRMYQDKTKIKNISDCVLLSCWLNLADMLTQHYKKECYLFVDEYDLPLTAALLNPSLPLNELNLISDFLIKFMVAFSKSGEEKIKRSLLTGVTRAGTKCPLNLNYLRYHRILDKLEISKYYGFTHEDVKELAEIFNEEDKLEELKIRYDGYRVPSGNDEDNLYPPIPILKYFKQGNIALSCPLPGKEMAVLFEYERNGSYFEKTIESGTVINMVKILDTDEFTEFRNFLTGNHKDDKYQNLNLARQYFFDCGLYTYAPGERNPRVGLARVVVANLEIKESFERALYTADYVCKKYNIQQDDKTAYVEAIAKVGPEEKSMLTLKSSIETVLKKVELDEQQDMHTILFGLIQERSRYSVKRIRNESKMSDTVRPVKKNPNTTIGFAEPDIVLWTLNNIGLLIVVEWNKSSLDAYNRIISKNLYEVFNRPPLKGKEIIHKGCLGINFSKNETVTITYSWDSLENPKNV